MKLYRLMMIISGIMSGILLAMFGINVATMPIPALIILGLGSVVAHILFSPLLEQDKL